MVALIRRSQVIVLVLVVVVATAVAALAVPQEERAPADQIVGTYTVDVPDFGVITIQVRHREEDDVLLISATEQPETVMQHVEADRYEVDTDMYGVVLIEFHRDAEGEIDSMSLDSYEFSLVAEKKRSQ